MVCPKCKNSGFLNTIMGKDFYYCRTCKEEILLEEVAPLTKDYDYGSPIYYLRDPDDSDGMDPYDPY